MTSPKLTSREQRLLAQMRVRGPAGLLVRLTADVMIRGRSLDYVAAERLVEAGLAEWLEDRSLDTEHRRVRVIGGPEIQ